MRCEDNYGETTFVFDPRDNSLIVGYCANDLLFTQYTADLLESIGVAVEYITWEEVFDHLEDFKLFLEDYHGYSAYEPDEEY